MDALNALPDDACRERLLTCCASEGWAAALVAMRPFDTPADLVFKAHTAWWGCSLPDWRQAYDAHGTLGEKSAEQKAAMSAADVDTLGALAAANTEYTAAFGNKCMVYAAGKSATELLGIVRARLARGDVGEENRVNAEQTALVTALRLLRMLGEGVEPSGRSPITTHVLDTTAGVPGAGIPVTLEAQLDGAWLPLASGVTDDDGRVGGLLPPFFATAFPPGVFRLRFSLEAYFAGRPCFFPEATLTFRVESWDRHFHVPLLASGSGMTSYRGS